MFVIFQQLGEASTFLPNQRHPCGGVEQGQHRTAASGKLDSCWIEGRWWQYGLDYVTCSSGLRVHVAGTMVLYLRIMEDCEIASAAWTFLKLLGAKGIATSSSWPY